MGIRPWLQFSLGASALSALGCGASGMVSLGGKSAAAPPAYVIYVRDRTGSVLAAIDDRGQLLSAERDDGFGLRLTSSGTPLPRAFLDQEVDEGTGYLHFRHRLYDPTTGQWISPDPRVRDDLDCSGQVHDCNPYAFAGERPLEWTDADGKQIDTFIGADGRVNQIRTVAFYGPQAAEVRQAYVEYLLTARSPVVSTVYTVVVPDAAHVPAGMTPVAVNSFSEGESGGREEARSTTVPSTSRITVRSDAWGDKLGLVVQHELNHAAGLPDGYFEGGSRAVDLAYRLRGIDLGDSLPGHVNGEMGNFFRDQGPTLVTPLEAAQLAGAPAEAVNRGLQFNADFFNAPTLEVTHSGGNLPAAPAAAGS